MSWILNVKRRLPILILTLSAACSPQRQARVLVRPPADPPAPAARAESCFQEGKVFLEKGDLDKARNSFDQCLDLLLAAGSGSPGRPGLIKDYVEKISALELNVIRDRSDKNNGQDDAFLDEVIATPLFSPSQQDVDSLQQKITAAPQVTYSIPIVVDPQVVSFLNAFQTIRHEGIQNALNRSQEYISAFKEVFRRYGIPEDLAYLPIIESGFRVGAVSRARAKGMWQFIAGTARLFGLRVDWLVDERLDPFKAVEAAAKYLRYLYDQYNDWYVALACYNGGPRRVERAMRKLQTQDFFDIKNSRIIRRETRNYVPAFIASLIIAKTPQEYGFEINFTERIFGDCKTCTIPSPVDLNQVALLLQVSVEELKSLNPELLTDFTPPNIESYKLRIPSRADETQLARLERVPASKIPTFHEYRVRRGDSLFRISRRFGVSVQLIKRTNKLHSNFIRPGQVLVIPRSYH